VEKIRFTEAQIVGILEELDGGTPATELARKHGIHASMIRLWRDKYAGMGSSDLVRIKLEAENAQMRRKYLWGYDTGSLASFNIPMPVYLNLSGLRQSVKSRRLLQPLGSCPRMQVRFAPLSETQVGAPRSMKHHT